MSTIDDERFVVNYDSGLVEVLAVTESIERRGLVEGKCARSSILVLQKSALAVLGLDEGSIEVRSLAGGNLLHQVVDHQSAVTNIVAAKNDLCMFSKHADRIFRQWVLDWELQV